MGWSIGYDSGWERDIGYGVIAVCDYPGCDDRIDRGLSHVCGGEPYGGEHLSYKDTDDGQSVQLCDRCCDDDEPFNPKPDALEWVKWKLTHDSWHQWREENPAKVQALQSQQS
jgi:hypothetical protein